MRKDINFKGAKMELDFWLISTLWRGIPRGILKMFQDNTPTNTYSCLGLPRLTEISVTHGSELTVRFRFVFSRFRFGSGLYFLTINVVKTDVF